MGKKEYPFWKMLCSLLNDTTTTKSTGITQTKANIVSIINKIMLLLTLIWLIRFSFLLTTAVSAFDIISSNPPIWLFFSEQRAVFINPAHYEIGRQNQHKTDQGLIKVGRSRHSDISILFQGTIHIGVYNIGYREQRA